MGSVARGYPAAINLKKSANESKRPAESARCLDGGRVGLAETGFTVKP